MERDCDCHRRSRGSLEPAEWEWKGLKRCGQQNVHPGREKESDCEALCLTGPGHRDVAESQFEPSSATWKGDSGGLA